MSEDSTVVFFRDDHFYPIELMSPKECGKSIKEQVKDHAELNPGTIKVETLAGEVLWRRLQ